MITDGHITLSWKAYPDYYKKQPRIIMVTIIVWVAFIHSEQKINVSHMKICAKIAIIVIWYTTQKWIFPLRISSVNVTKSAGNCGNAWGKQEEHLELQSRQKGLRRLHYLCQHRIIAWKAHIIKQKDESQNCYYKRAKHIKLSEKRTFFTPWYAQTRFS